MCTYLTTTTAVSGSGLDREGAFGLTDAVVYFDHPQEAPLEHALCIDFRGNGGSAEHVAVELDATSARRLATAILSTLDSDEVRALV
jgi:hypothetical protein